MRNKQLKRFIKYTMNKNKYIYTYVDFINYLRSAYGSVLIAELSNRENYLIKNAPLHLDNAGGIVGLVDYTKEKSNG